jgi:2-C-methyl-D-erythritol 2,4-cyclodiphosphate synthase
MGRVPSALSRGVDARYNPRLMTTASSLRVGIGHDSHRLEVNRPLWLGGIRIPHSRGLVGHSDADVVLHAITDALLGAAGLGDIGECYPDSDPAYKDCPSSRFVEETVSRITAAGWRIINADVTIMAQEPKLGPQKAKIRTRVAQLLETEAINIKAKTGEGVGTIGRAEAIACQAIVLIEKMESVPKGRATQ